MYEWRAVRPHAAAAWQRTGAIALASLTGDLATSPESAEESVLVLQPGSPAPRCDIVQATLTQDGTGQEMRRLTALAERCGARVLLGDAPRGAALADGLQALKEAGFTYRLEKVVASQFGARVAKARLVLLACRGDPGAASQRLETAAAQLHRLSQPVAEGARPCLLPLEAIEEHRWLP